MGTAATMTPRVTPLPVVLSIGALLAVVALLYITAPLQGTGRWAFGNAVLLTGTLTAVLSLQQRWRNAPHDARPAWAVFTLGAAAALVGQILWAGEELLLRRPIPFPSLGFYLFVAFHVLVAAGALAALRPAHVGTFGFEIALDGLLVLLATALVVLRVFLEPVLAHGWISREQANAMLAGQVAVAGSAFSLLYLVIWKDTRLAARATLTLAIAAGVFLVGNVLVAMGADPDPSHVGDPFDLIWLAGWMSFAVAGRLGTANVRPVSSSEQREQVARGLRRVVVPVAALLLAAAGVDATFRRYVSTEFKVLVGVMGIILAIRIGSALYAAERHANERRRAEVAAQQARLRVLASQLSPHFLFNTLNSLSALLRRDPAAAEDGLLRLGNLLRYPLDDADADRVPLAAEWQFTGAYLELERLRLGDRVRVTVEMDDEAAHCLVPRLIVQPVAENAVRHAAAVRSSGADIALRAWVEGERLCIVVRDDGPGADPAGVAQSPGLGLRTARARLEAQYGHQGVLQVQTAPGAGFLVSMQLPAQSD